MNRFVGDLIRKNPDGDVYAATDDGKLLKDGSVITEGDRAYRRGRFIIGSDPDDVFVQLPVATAVPIATMETTRQAAREAEHKSNPEPHKGESHAEHERKVEQHHPTRK